MIDIQCPKCDELMRVPTSAIGEKVACPKCASQTIVRENAPNHKRNAGVFDSGFRSGWRCDEAGVYGFPSAEWAN